MAVLGPESVFLHHSFYYPHAFLKMDIGIASVRLSVMLSPYPPVNLILCGLLVLILAVTNPDNEPDLFESNEINQSSCLWKLKLTFSALNTQPNRRCRMNVKNNVGSCLVFHLLIMPSGDVEMNPGPPKYPCGICSKKKY